MPTTYKNTFYFTIALITQKIISFVYFTLVARSIGVENTGIYVFSLVFTSLFSVIADFGISPAANREIAKNPGNAQQILSSAIAVKIPLLFLSYFLILIVIKLLNVDSQTENLVVLSGVTMVLDSMHLLFYSVFRGLKDLRFESVGVICSQLITLILGTIFLNLRLPLIFLILAFTISSFFNVSFTFFLLKKLHRIKFVPVFKFEQIKNLFKIAFAFGTAGIFSRLFSSLDSIILSRFSGHAALGFYSVPNKIAFAFQFIPMALVAAIFPAMSSSYADKNDNVANIFKESLRYLSIIAFPIAFGIITLSEEIILKIYGTEFQQSIWPLIILMCTMIFAFLGFPIGSVLNATGRQAMQTKLMGIAVIINIILNIFLIPKFSFTGSAVAALISYIFLTLSGYYAATKIIRIHTIDVIKLICKSFAAALLMAVIIHFFKKTAVWWLAIPIGFFVYLFFICAFRLVKKSDLKILAGKTEQII